MASIPVTQALSCITNAELFYFTLVSCNVNCKTDSTPDEVREELETLYYFCLGKHSLFILDRMMVAHERFGGTLVRIPYACIDLAIFSKAASHSEFLLLSIGLERLPKQHKVAFGQPSSHGGASKTGGASKAAGGEARRHVPRVLVCNTAERDTLLIKLRTCWKADHMFQHWRVGVLPETRVEDGLTRLDLEELQARGGEELTEARYNNFIAMQASREVWIEALVRPLLGIDEMFDGVELPDAWKGDTTGVALDFTVEPQGLKKFTHNKYAFFCPTTFRRGPRSQPDLFYDVQGSNRERSRDAFYVRVKPARPLQEDANTTLKQIVDEVIENQVMPHIQSYQRVGAPKEYYKKMNLTGDPASWEAWEVHIRAQRPKTQNQRDVIVGEREIGIIACRRKYIPPVMDSSQVIVVTYFGGKGKWDHDETFMDSPERIVDSLTATSLCHVPDRLVIQTKADALLFDEEGYAWFHKRLNVQPRAMRMAKQFCAVILQLLASTGLGDALENALAELGADLGVPPSLVDPFVIAVRLEKDSLGLPSDAPAECFRDWKRRVWRYLAYCVDGGLAPKSLKIESLVYQHGALVGNKRHQNMLGSVIETLLYMHAPGTEHQSSISLKVKLEDARLMADFTYNERVMIRLLETGYIRKQLSLNEDRSQYPRFLIRLMRRSPGRQENWHTRVRYTVCKELVTMSMDQANRRTGSRRLGGGADHQNASLRPADDVAVNMLVPMISRLLHERDENLQVLAVCALVNYTHNNTPMKNTVMASGAVRKVATFLGSHNEDLVRHSCALLRNCTKTPQYRQTVASYGVIRQLFSLLEESESPPTFRPLPILVQAIAILGQLAYDPDIKQKITEALGFQPTSFSRGRDSDCPTVIRVLQKFLRPEQELGGQLISEARHEALYFHVGIFLLSRPLSTISLSRLVLCFGAPLSRILHPTTPRRSTR